MILIYVLFLSACASHVPIEIRQPPLTNPTLAEVQTNLEQFRNHTIRWGGRIISVENKADTTWIEILATPLNSYGKPSHGDHNLGRFLVWVDGFLDPQIYKQDRLLTVFGVVENRIIREIDNHPYNYPLVKATTYYLWIESPRHYYRYYPYYPYYYPYPYIYRYHYPYYSPYYRYHFGYHYRHHPSIYWGLYHHY